MFTYSTQTKMVAQERMIYPPPIQVGGSFEQPPIEGRRNLENSPQLFPHLSSGGCELLREVAQTALLLEEQLSLYSTLSNQSSQCAPPSIQRVVDIAEGLVRKPETSLLSPGKDGVGLGPRSYFLRHAAEKKVATYEGGKTRYRLDAFEMSFSPNGGSPQGNRDVQISLRPNTIRKTFAANGKPISHLEGIPKEEVEEIISYRGRSPEETLQTAETREEIYPTFTITSGGAKFQMVFYGGVAYCELSIEGINYDRQSFNNETGLPEIKTKYSRSSSTAIPLVKFSLFKHNHLSQEAIDRWLNAIASELAKEAEKAMTAKKTRQSNPR